MQSRMRSCFNLNPNFCFALQGWSASVLCAAFACASSKRVRPAGRAAHGNPCLRRAASQLCCGAEVLTQFRRSSAKSGSIGASGSLSPRSTSCSRAWCSAGRRRQSFFSQLWQLQELKSHPRNRLNFIEHGIMKLG